MKLYHNLSKISFLKKSYTYKFFFVAFLGIHIPLIGLIITLVFNKGIFSVQTILLFTLFFTLLASFVTLYVINKLITPIDVASKALSKYRRKRIVPNLPLRYKDEAGRLFYNVQRTINDNENYLNQKQDMVTLLTHDMRNYVSHPKSLATLLLEETDIKEIQKISEQIVKSSDNQLNFLESFLDFLREEDVLSNLELEVNTINLSNVLEKIEEEISAKLHEKNIVLKKEIGCKTADLLVDEMLFSRVIFNLLHNAIKFSHSDSEVTVNIVLKKEYLEIKVKDNGIGFNDYQKTHLYSKFSKMSQKGTSNEDSLGIGLYLCRQIVTKFNGYIDAYNDGENNGAIFTVGFRIE